MRHPPREDAVPVHLIATLDTKGSEAGYVRDRLRELGIAVQVVDAGCMGEPAIAADVTREAVFAAAGTSLAAARARGDRGAAVEDAARGCEALVREAHAKGQLEGVIALGGSAGTSIGTRAMRALPIGVPKVMVSTLASGNTRGFVADKDITMVNSIVDILGLNRISRVVLDGAAHALAGMVRHRRPAHAGADRPLVAATMFGVTTKCVEAARKVLEAAGYEVLVFHATGNGGQAMESLIRDGAFAGVLDVTTTELADELVGGVLSAGPDRLTAAARCGTPQVVSVGALDMVNFFGADTVPARFQGRRFHRHNANVTLMRTTPEENAKLGTEIGTKVATSRGPAAVLLPALGVSALDAPGQPFEDAEARAELYSAIRASCGTVPCETLDLHINDERFATALAHRLLALMRTATPR